MCIDTLTEAGGKTLAFPQNLEEFPSQEVSSFVTTLPSYMEAWGM